MSDTARRAPGSRCGVRRHRRVAIGALRISRVRRFRCPSDVAVIGFDDLAMRPAYQSAPDDGPSAGAGLGKEMARMLISAIEGHRPSPLILPTRLTVRESAPDLPASDLPAPA